MGQTNDDVLPAVNTARRLISSAEQRNRETAFVGGLFVACRLHCSRRTIHDDESVRGGNSGNLRYLMRSDGA